jgi:hypothetical protein
MIGINIGGPSVKKVGNYKRCPDCDEKLLAAAVKCPKCKFRFVKKKKVYICKDCPAEISPTADRCKPCFGSYRTKRREEKKAERLQQVVSGKHVKRVFPSPSVAITSPPRSAPRPKRIIPPSKTCLYFLQLQESPNQWIRANYTIQDPSLYTKNRIAVSVKDSGDYSLDVMAHDISAEALQAGLMMVAKEINR